MRTKWKFPVYFSGLVLAITATAVSCSKDSTAPQSQSVSSAVAQKAPEAQVNPSWAGTYHTDALAYVYSKLSNAGNLGTQYPQAVGWGAGHPELPYFNAVMVSNGAVYVGGQFRSLGGRPHSKALH